MDATLRARWLRALRGRKYQQATGALKERGKFCCLGVLADIQGAKWVNGLPVFDGDDSQNDGCALFPRFAGGLRKETQNKLANMNDDGADFKTIADYIERKISAA